MQHLKDTDISSRLSFAQWMLRIIGLTDVIWLSDEAHFTLDGHVKKQTRVSGELQNQTFMKKTTS